MREPVGPIRWAGTETATHWPSFIDGAIRSRRARSGGDHGLKPMTILVTGSAGHLGEALMRTLAAERRDAIGIDVLASPFTTHVGSIVDRAFVRRHMAGVDAVLHAATLHKPHVATHRRQDFVDTNVTGTLNLLEEAVAAGVQAFVFTSTTSVFGDALIPPAGAPAAWITEDVTPVPKNIYGVTKAAAEDLCELFHRNHGLACHGAAHLALLSRGGRRPAMRARAMPTRTSRRTNFSYRRVDIEDVVSAHLLAVEQAPRARLRPLHHQRDHAVPPEDLAGIARRCAARAAAARAGVRSRICAARLAHVSRHRPGLRQRARARRARLAAAPRLRRRHRALARRRRPGAARSRR